MVPTVLFSDTFLFEIKIVRNVMLGYTVLGTNPMEIEFHLFKV